MLENRCFLSFGAIFGQITEFDRATFVVVDRSSNSEFRICQDNADANEMPAVLRAKLVSDVLYSNWEKDRELLFRN